MRKNVLTVIELAVLVMISFMVCFFLYRGQAVAKKLNVEDCVSDNEDLLINLDSVEQDTDFIVIWGWAILQGTNTEYFDTKVLLKNTNTEEYYQISTAFQIRTDVTEAYGNEEFTYNNSGFYAKVEKSRLPQTGDYEIYIQYNSHSDNILQSTGTVVTVG